MQREVMVDPGGVASGALPRRVCLLVLGMHRSGTSAMARVIGLLGADLPKTLLGPTPGNERGHWEPAPLIAQHDRLLDQLGSRWDDWRKLDLDALPRPVRDEAARAFHTLVEQEYAGSPLFVLKEPRICRFAPFIVELLAARSIATRHVVVLRNPLAVIASLGERDGMTPGFAALLWLRHVLDAEAATRHAPRAIVSYESLLLDWRAAMRTTGARVGIRWPCPIEVAGAQIDAFLSAELQHYAPSRHELAARGDIADWVKVAYVALRALERDADDETACAQLDAIAAEFDAVAPTFAAAMFPELAARDRRASERQARQVAAATDELRQGLAGRDGAIAELRGELAARARQAEELQSQIAAVQADVLERAADMAGARAESAALRGTVAAREEKIAGLGADIARHEAQIAKLSSEISLRDTQLAEVRSALMAANTQLKAVLNSNSWRITAPLRGLRLLAGALPTRARRTQTAPAASAASDTRCVAASRMPAGVCKPVERDYPDTFHLRSLQPTSAIAVVAHVFYQDLWPELRDAVSGIAAPFDLFVTLTQGHSEELKDTIVADFPAAHVLALPNHGRDIYPFVFLNNTGVLCKYDLICKVHSKKSPHRTDGALWRRSLLSSLLGDADRIAAIIDKLSKDPDIGIVAADGNVYSSEHWGSNTDLVGRLASRLHIEFDERHIQFAAGSMFWIRPLILRMLQSLEMTPDDFEAEGGQLDGTMAHAIERLLGIVAQEMGMKVLAASELLRSAHEGRAAENEVRLVAFYLPQFHPIAENDRWWGPGFTEWTNVVQAAPLFDGHYQPRLPAELGFYDLRLGEVRQAQAQLARQHGVDAFCYYYYWFEGRRVLERPLEEMVDSGLPDFPFCLCWANENWTRSWDGLNQDVLLRQDYTPEGLAKFAHGLTRYFGDRRYLRHRGQPVLVIYRLSEIPQYTGVTREWRRIWRKAGLGEIHLCAVRFHTDDLPPRAEDAGIDAYVGFPPHGVAVRRMEERVRGLEQGFEGLIYDYHAVVDGDLRRHAQSVSSRLHRGVMTGWDNTARRGIHAHICHGSSPASFRRWLRSVVLQEGAWPPGEEKLVFINAWNEWAEGAYLEPDKKHGRGYLEAVRSVRPQAPRQNK